MFCGVIKLKRTKDHAHFPSYFSIVLSNKKMDQSCVIFILINRFWNFISDEIFQYFCLWNNFSLKVWAELDNSYFILNNPLGLSELSALQIIGIQVTEGRIGWISETVKSESQTVYCFIHFSLIFSTYAMICSQLPQRYERRSRLTMLAT